MNRNKWYYTILIILVGWETATAQIDSVIIDSLGTITLEKTKTNGAYISIIKGEEVLYSNAFGYNDMETKTVLTDSTIFPISSNTKAFNSILLSQLVEKEKLSFDKPLISYLPDLKFASDFITQEITLLDLLTHRVGIPRYDFTYYVLDEEERKNPNQAVFNKLRYLESASSFRTTFQYGNNQYIVAAYLLEQLTKQKWEQQLEEKILQPLGMTDTHCDLALYKKSKHIAECYQNKAPVSIDLVAPLYQVSGMGNMFSSIRDLEKWSRFLLEGDQAILSMDWLRYNQQGHFVVGYEEPFEGFSSIEYGLGWYVFDYYGSKVVLHHGDNVGHQSLIVLLPDDNIAFQLMANEGMGTRSFCFRMAFSLLDMIKLDHVNDWNERRETGYTYTFPYADSIPIIPTTVKLKNYQGLYQHEGFGDINIIVQNNQLYAKAGYLEHTLEYIGEDRFVFHAEAFKEAYIFKFERKDAKIIGLETDIVDLNVKRTFFKRVH